MIQGLFRQRSEFKLDRIQPAAVFRCEVELQFSGQTMCFFWTERLVQGSLGVRREVIQHHTNGDRSWVQLVYELFHASGNVHFRMPLRHLKVHSTSVRFQHAEEIQASQTRVEVVVARQSTG